MAVAILQVLLALGVSARLAWDRLTLPRVWALSLPVDPSDPLRGRYVRLRLAALERRTTSDGIGVYAVQDNRLVMVDDPNAVPRTGTNPLPLGDSSIVRSAALAFFIPENIPDPSLLKPGEELWVEVTVPQGGGLPRPIRIEVRRSGT